MHQPSFRTRDRIDPFIICLSPSSSSRDIAIGNSRHSWLGGRTPISCGRGGEVPSSVRSSAGVRPSGRRARRGGSARLSLSPGSGRTSWDGRRVGQSPRSGIWRGHTITIREFTIETFHVFLYISKNLKLMQCLMTETGRITGRAVKIPRARSKRAFKRTRYHHFPSDARVAAGDKIPEFPHVKLACYTKMYNNNWLQSCSHGLYFLDLVAHPGLPAEANQVLDQHTCENFPP